MTRTTHGTISHAINTAVNYAPPSVTVHSCLAALYCIDRVGRGVVGMMVWLGRVWLGMVTQTTMTRDTDPTTAALAG